MKYVIVPLLIMLCASGFGYDGAFFNLYAPESGISEGDFEFSMNHRFFGAAFKDEPFDTFFGLDSGANVRFSFRYFPVENLSFGLSHSRLGSTNSIYAGWSESLLSPGIEFGLVAGYESVKLTSNSDREGGIIATAAVSAWLLNNRIRPLFNYSYDGYREDGGASAGLEVNVRDRMSLIGEYFLSTDSDDLNNCYTFGCRYSTWGHQFMLGMTNSFGVSAYEQLAGSSTSDLSIALSIRRLI